MPTPDSDDRAAPTGRSMAQPYLGPPDGPGIAAEGGAGEGGTQAAMEFAEMIVDTVREGLLVLDLDLRVQAANESFYRMFGATRGQTEGHHVFDLAGGALDVPDLRELLERVLPERHAFDDFEVTHTTEGGERTLLLNARQLDHHQMVLLAVEDVTDRERAAEALRTSEARYRALFDAMGQGYCVLQMIYDADGQPVDYRFLETNPAFESESGLADAVGRTARELIPGLESHWVEAYGRVAETGEPARFEQGSEAMGRWFSVQASRVGGPGSGRVALLFTDVTERRAVEEERRENEARFRALFAQAPAFLAVLRGADHRFEFVNAAYLDLVGDRRLLGMPVREALPEFEGQGLFEMLDRVLRSGEAFKAVDRPLRVRRSRSGEAEHRYADFVYQPLREPDGSVDGVIALGVDTTERVRAGRALDRARRDLEHANQQLEERVRERTREVRQLAARLAVAEQEERRRIAHLLHDDLQQRLYGAAVTLSLVPRSAADERAGLVERAGAVLAEAAALARSLSVELSPAVLETDRLGDVLRWLAERNRERYGLAVEVTGDADVGDAALRTLLYHLVREALFNVVKHAETDRVAVSLDEADGRVVVRVEDAGAGFDPADLDGAAGAGISSIRERLEVVGGRLHVASAPGEGTRLTLTLPVEPTADEDGR